MKKSYILMQILMTFKYNSDIININNTIKVNIFRIIGVVAVQ